MNRHPCVSVLWDASAQPTPELSGFQVVNAITSAANTWGPVQDFKLYADVSGSDSPSPTFRFQVKCAGVTLVDTASNGQAGSATKTILVDAFIHALDNPPSSHTIVMVSVDPDICYGVALLRARGHQVFILCPPNSHPNLMELSFDTGFDKSVLRNQADTWSGGSVSKAPASGHVRRTSFRGETSSGEQRENETIPTLPTPALEAFREHFEFSSSSEAPIHDRHSDPSRSNTITPDSSRSSSPNPPSQFFQTPEAQVDMDDEDEFISITPPTLIGNAPFTVDGTPETRSSSLSFKSSTSGFFVLPTFVSAVEASSPTASSQDNAANGNDLSSTQSDAVMSQILQEPFKISKVASSTSTATVKATFSSASPPLVPIATDIQAPAALPPAQRSASQESTTVSFFPSPPSFPNISSAVFTPRLSALPAATPTLLGNAKGQAAGGGWQPIQVVPEPHPALPALLSHPSAESTVVYLPNATMPAKSIPIPTVTKAKAISTPQTSTSCEAIISTHSQTSGAAAPEVPARFSTLVAIMKERRTKAKPKVTTRNSLGAVLPTRQADVYLQAGITGSHKLDKYLRMAVDAGVVSEVNGVYVLSPAL